MEIRNSIIDIYTPIYISKYHSFVSTHPVKYMNQFWEYIIMVYIVVILFKS